MNREKIKIFSSAYFPSVQYFAHLISTDNPLLEIHENYIKQTYRNRCRIYSPNGPLDLTVPVERGSFHKVALKDLRIDYSMPWQDNHLRALKTAYNSSAFYEFYIDDLESCIMESPTLLLDLNNKIMKIIIDILDVDLKISFTEEYKTDYHEALDLRSSITPKTRGTIPGNDYPTYFQVFAPKLGFEADLSILDLIFNMGPESYSYLISI